MCGEQDLLAAGEKVVVGSPPRVRGTALLLHETRSHKRITPACAGNREMGGFIEKEEKDHPRVCGEQEVTTKVSTEEQGSPPRVRGTVLKFF